MTFITFLRACLSPPGLQILLVLLGLWALRRQRLAWGRSLIGLGLVSLWLMATPQGAAWLLQGLERYPAIAEPSRLRAEGWQAIVVIGGGRDHAAPEFGGRDVPNYWTASRLRYAASLYRQTGLPVAVSGGRRAGDTVPEASLMHHSLVHDHVTNVYWTEDDSATTWENAINSRRLLAPQGIDRIILVTQAAHMLRAKAVFEHAGFQVKPAPLDFETDAARLPVLLRFAPRAERLMASAQACHEYLGLLWYRLRMLVD